LFEADGIQPQTIPARAGIYPPGAATLNNVSDFVVVE
jgi:hypothetical protein